MFHHCAAATKRIGRNSTSRWPMAQSSAIARLKAHPHAYKRKKAPGKRKEAEPAATNTLAVYCLSKMA
jgi:hypothetical protein